MHTQSATNASCIVDIGLDVISRRICNKQQKTFVKFAYSQTICATYMKHNILLDLVRNTYTSNSMHMNNTNVQTLILAGVCCCCFLLSHHSCIISPQWHAHLVFAARGFLLINQQGKPTSYNETKNDQKSLNCIKSFIGNWRTYVSHGQLTIKL